MLPTGMRHRSLLLGLVLVLLGGCFKSSGSGATATATPSNSVRGVDYSATLLDPVGFLPIDSEVVLSVDGDQLRGSALWRMVEPKLMAAAGQDLVAFKQFCNIDPVASIRDVTIGIKNLQQETPDGVLVVGGLDGARMLDCMKRSREAGETSVSIENGIVVIDDTDKSGQPDQVVFAFADATTLVMLVGPKTTKQAFLAVLASGAPLRKSPMFSELLQQVDVSAPVWGVMNGSSSAFDDLRGMGIKARAVFGSAQLGAGLAVSMKLRLENAQEAQGLAGMAQGQLGAAKNFFERLEVTAEATDVVVVAAMTDAQLQSMIGLLGGMFGSP